MRSNKYVKVLILIMFITIPYHVLGYSCVLNGSGTSCTMYSPLSDKNVECGSRPNYIKCTHSAKEEVETIKGACRNVTEPTSHLECDPDNTITKYKNIYTFELKENNRCDSITINGYSIKYWNKWTSTSGSFGPYLDRKQSKDSINADGCLAYDGESITTINGKQYYMYTTKWSRCCYTPKDDPPDIDVYKCYRADLSTEDNPNNYDYQWTDKKPSNNYQEVKGISSKDACELLNPNKCTKSNLSSDKKYNNACVNNASTNDLIEVSCQNESTDFYEVKCQENFNTDYSPKLNGTNLSIKSGLGFDYQINLESKRECTATFNSTDWNDAYSKAYNLLERAKKSGDEKEKAYYQNKLNEITSAITSYNNWNSGVSNKNISATINIKYNEKDKSNKIKEINQEEKFVISKGESSTKKENLSGCVTLANNTNICPYKITITENYSLTPPQTFLDKYSGEVLNDSDGKLTTTSAIDGGNKFYISMNAVSGSNYTISTNITGLGINGGISIKNSNCSLNIIEPEKELYRIINESNPFVNNQREIGKNWSSNLFDFTRIITKSNEALYTFNLSRNDILLIKQSNANDPSAYLGTCNRPSNMQDQVMRNICNEINKYD